MVLENNLIIVWRIIFLAWVVTVNAIFLKDVENLMEEAEHLPGTFASGSLWSSLIDAVKWLRQASGAVSARSNSERCNLSDAEEILASSQVHLYNFYCLLKH